MQFIRKLKEIKTFAVFCGLVIAVFLTSTIAGYRLLGDDNDEKDTAVGNSARHSRNNYYHK